MKSAVPGGSAGGDGLAGRPGGRAAVGQLEAEAHAPLIAVHDHIVDAGTRTILAGNDMDDICGP